MKLAFLFLGMFLGYAVCDLLNVESKIVYHIKRLKNKNSPGGVITVEAEAKITRKQRRKTRREERRKNK